VTYGEDLFLHLHDSLASRVEIGVGSSRTSSLDFLGDPTRFNEFVKLIGSINVFLRVHRAAVTLLHANNEIADNAIVRVLRDQVMLDLPARTLVLLAQLARQAATVALGNKLSNAMRRAIWRSEPKNCYLCGTRLVDSGGGRNARSVDHIWPQTLGGQSIFENLMPCCRDCNELKRHDITWAWGPVQSTYEVLSQADMNPSDAVRLSLALARLMFVAGATDGRSTERRTLKEAAKYIGVAVPRLELTPHQPYTYLELLDMAQTSIQ
jgi:hypothetical protein